MGRKIFMMKKFLLAVCLLIISNCCLATDDPEISKNFRGATEFVKDVTGSIALTKELSDDIFYDPLLNPTIANPANDKITNVVSLQVREGLLPQIVSDFTAKVNIRIDYTLVNGTTGSVNSTFLEVSYTKAGGVKYNGRQTIKFDQCRRVKVTIIDVPYKSVAWDVWAVLELENRMLRKRDYVFNYNQRLPANYVGATIDELTIDWTPDATVAPGKTHVDIEWTWVDYEALESYKKDDGFGNMRFSADLLFRNNSSRVTVSASQHQFAIPKIYDGKGMIFYRIRPVQYREDGQVINGIWSFSETYYEGLRSYVQEEGQGHQENLNWQRTTSFAEEGKNKTVIQYYDGTLRGRQTVTKDNVTNKTVVAETFYDYQGRAAISVLPAPTMQTVINFTLDFNKFVGNFATPKDAFDLVPANTAVCSYITPGLDGLVSGAAKYYSAENPEVTDGFNKYIPESQGYPFVETSYTPDGTGRIAAQGGVGPNFQLNGTPNATTKYFYGKPDQKELDALFGTEAGEASHYFKNMVRDANGQYSVSYVDGHGRTVATALAGDPPGSVKPLDSYTQGFPTIEKTLLTNSNNKIEGRSIVSSSSIVVPKQAMYTFKYRMSALDLKIANCLEQDICYDCYYDLEIRISGPCGEPTVIKETNLTFGTDGTPIVGEDCEGKAPVISKDITIQLEEGAYDIVKILTVSKRAQDQYREHLFTENNICKTLQDFIDEKMLTMQNQLTCDITCESCTTNIGTYSQYRTAYLTDQGINPLTTVSYESQIKASWDEAVKGCAELCKGTDNVIASIEDAMLNDMTPGEGQYARFNEETNTAYNLPHNIFWGGVYKAQTYHTATGEVETEDFSSMTPQDFTDKFQLSWAKDLLPLHPEYCKLQKAKEFLLSSYTYDKLLRGVDTWQGAVDLDLIEDPAHPAEGIGVLADDPFYAFAPTFYKTIIKQYINTNFNWYTTTTPKSLWSLAWMSVFCHGPASDICLPYAHLKPSEFVYSFSGDMNTCTVQDKDRLWRVFRDLYLTQKERMVNNWLQSVCPVNYTPFASNNYERRFGQLEDYYTSQMTTVMNQVNNPPADINVNADLLATYQANCAAYQEAWVNELNKCLAGHPYQAAIINEIKAELTTICEKGSDENHPFGSSSIAPTEANTYNDFPAAITAIFAKPLYNVTLSALCHPDMITFPQRFDHQMPLSNEPIAKPWDECVCTKLQEFGENYVAEDPDKTIWANLRSYIESKYNLVITTEEWQAITAVCAKGCVPETVTTVPAIFGCTPTKRNCIECDLYLEHKGEFITQFPPLSSNVMYGAPANDNELNANLAFANFMNNRTGFAKTWYEYYTFEQHCALTRSEGNSAQAVVYRLCSDMTQFPVITTPVENCDDYLYTLAFNQVYDQYQLYLQEQKDNFDKTYLEKCLNTVGLESFTYSTEVPEYHYTLYYYNQAGNLVKTVPPEGVRPNFNTTFLENVQHAREDDNLARIPVQHALVTQYCYNALNQVTKQYSPDGGESSFWYDQLGRLVVSQNAKQKLANKYSYTKYDLLGRITEVGEKSKTPAYIVIDQEIAQGQNPGLSLEAWLAPSHSDPNKNITHTIYDLKYDPLCAGNILCQQNLRNRVSYSYVQKEDNGDAPVEAPWESATFYTYDIHGNVDVLLQDYKTGMGSLPGGNRFKRVEYKYDLISGKVNEVAYQPGAADAFYHRYEYDAENKLIEAKTSKEYVYWETDASYKYYRHGPLARTVLGHYGVQGVDYAYTLQGWLKGVNSTSIMRGGQTGEGSDCGPGSGVQILHVNSRSNPYAASYKATGAIILEPGFESLAADDFTASIDPLLTSCGPGSEGTAGTDLPVAAYNGIYDMGRDGWTGEDGEAINTNNTDLYGHNTRTTDAYGYSLNYFNYDYTQIDQTSAAAFFTMSHPLNPTGAGGLTRVGDKLYNGNIAAMLVNIPKLGEAKVYGYKYDQLNRITDMVAFNGVNNGANGFSPLPVNDFNESVTYDANGNIKTYKRNGFQQGGFAMDNLYYQYEKDGSGNITSNKLRYVYDDVQDDHYTEDIKTQKAGPLSSITTDLGPLNGSDNYAYDAIGNLIKDTKEGISNIEWNVYGKIERIQKSKTEGGISTQTDITYTYDVSGNRISKKVAVTKTGTTIDTYKATTTFYVRDASGNVMSVYQTGQTPEGGALNSNLLNQTEVHLYGSSRLGILNTKVDVGIESRTFLAMTGTTLDRGELFTFERGATFFELSNHLGNVLVTITDKKIGMDGSRDGTIDYYNPDVVTANDYYPFGMLMPGRKYDGGSGYRYGFNGKELDNDGFSTTTYDYGFRIYSPGIGKFLSVDPLTQSFPWYTPYQFAGNKPIVAIDLDGLEEFVKTNWTDIDGNITKTMISVDENGPKQIGSLIKTYTNRMNADGSSSRVGVTFTYLSALDFTNQDIGYTNQRGFTKFDLKKHDNPVFGNGDINKSLFIEFMQGIGSENTVVYGGQMLEDIKSLPSVQTVREKAYYSLQKLTTPLKEGNMVWLFHKFTYSEGFWYVALPSILRGGAKDWTGDPESNPAVSTRHFLGSFQVSATLLEDLKTLMFVVSDSKTMESLSDHQNEGNSINREDGKIIPNGSTYQRYVWFEELHIPKSFNIKPTIVDNTAAPIKAPAYLNLPKN